MLQLSLSHFSEKYQNDRALGKVSGSDGNSGGGPVLVLSASHDREGARLHEEHGPVPVLASQY